MSSQDEYRRIKGRVASPSVASIVSTDSPPPAPRPALRPLTDSERARAEKMRTIVIEQMPEFLPFIREAVAFGMVDGWRSVAARKIKHRDE